MTDDVSSTDAMAILDVGDEGDQRVHLLVGKGLIAQFVARIDDLDADRDVVEVALALPARHAGVKGAPRLGHQPTDPGRRCDQGRLAAAELGAGLGRVEPDQLLADPDDLALADENLGDDAPFEVGDDLKLRARDHPAHAAHRALELGEGGPDEEDDDETGDAPQQQVGRRAWLHPGGQVLEMGAVHFALRLRPPPWGA